MADREFYELITVGKERRNLEYKESMSWNDSGTKAKITKSILAMSNIRDGGSIILGVKQQSNGTFEPIGMDQVDANTFKDDDVKSHVAEYTDPYVQFSVDHYEREGEIFLIIRVEEFDELPVICKKSGLGLQRGKIYTRSRRKPESTEALSQSEMREIIDMAVDKGIRRFYQRLSRTGVISPPSMPPSDEELFEKQLKGLR